jgi:signal transduction histidine kinase
MLREGDELVIAATAGRAHAALGRRLAISDSTSGQVLKSAQPQRITDVEANLRVAPAELGVPQARTALLVPMLNRGIGIGVLAAFDHGEEGGQFSADDERLLRSFAQSAANAVAIKRSVEADRLRAAIAAADSERGRWARELHDQTLQALGGLRVLLASALSRGDAASREVAMRQAVEDIELEIANLREIITDLRPALLDDLGLLAAIESLLDRRREADLEIDSRLELPSDGGRVLEPELETIVYRLVQEALTNVVKHANARTVRVSVSVEESDVVVKVSDDGAGFDVNARPAGFGLAGMRERVSLAGGALRLESSSAGTVLRAELPLQEASAIARRGLSADQVAG